TTGPAVETWSPAVAAPGTETWSPAPAAPAAETWEAAGNASGPGIAARGAAPDTWGRATETWTAAAETRGPAPAEPTTTLPRVAMKRVGVVAAVFFLYSLFAGFAGAPEFAGLLVGLMYGLVLARRAGEQEPT